IGFTVEGEPTPADGDSEVATYRAVLPGYFRTMGIPILRGRDISPAADARAPHGVVINQKLADQHWPRGDAGGTRTSVGMDQATLTRGGVVKDARQHAGGEKVGGEICVSVAQARRYLDNPGGPFAYMTLVVRTVGAPAALAGSVGAAVRDLDPAVSVSS